MIIYLYKFNPFIDINENCKYLSRNNALPIESGKHLFKETICFNFKLDIGVSNLNHMNEFVPVTKLMKGRKNENPVHPVKSIEKI